jgi:hypothetical protein
LSLITEIDAGLAAMETGINRAARIAADAETGAGTVVARMAGTGFVGIAQTVGRVQAAIAQIRARIHGIGVAVAEARTPVMVAPPLPTPQQIIAVLGPLPTALEGVHQLVGAAIAQVGEVARLTALSLQGGRPGTLLAALAAVRTILITVDRHALDSRSHTEAALAEAYAAGDAGTAPDVDDTGESENAEEFAGLSNERARELLAVLPVFGGEGAKTRGTFLGRGGREEPLASGKNDETAALAARLGLAKVASANTHLEAHVARIMHRRRLRRAAVVVNREPCPGIFGCDTLLARLLPAGAELTVYGPNGFKKTYTGREGNAS